MSEPKDSFALPAREPNRTGESQASPDPSFPNACPMPDTPEVFGMDGKHAPEVIAHSADSGIEGREGDAPPPSAPVSVIPIGRRPTFVFFGLVAAVSLLLDVGTKAWAEVYFNRNLMGHTVQLVEGHLALVLAYNKGGAWGLGHGWSDALRLPFFLFVSVAAIAFIVSLYARLLPRQHALKWGLPLVLGGALGNLTDRIVRNQVIDFIDYRADWVRSMNEWVARAVVSDWSVTDHWPTFNVADIAICAGVALMAVDMLTARRGRPGPHPVHRASSPESMPLAVSERPPADGAPELAADLVSDAVAAGPAVPSNTPQSAPIGPTPRPEGGAAPQVAPVSPTGSEVPPAPEPEATDRG